MNLFSADCTKSEIVCLGKFGKNSCEVESNGGRVKAKPPEKFCAGRARERGNNAKKMKNALRIMVIFFF